MLTPHAEKQREQEAAGTFDTPGSPGISSFSFTNGSHPVEFFINGDKSVRADVIFNHVHVIGFLYIQDGILTKEFLPKRTTYFSSNVRTVTAASGSCWELTPFRVADKILSSDVFTFGHVEIDAYFPSISVGSFLSEVVDLAAAGIYPKLPGNLEKTRAIIKEEPTSGNGVSDVLRKYHEAAGEWGCVHENISLAHNSFINKRSAPFLLLILPSTSTKTPTSPSPSSSAQRNIHRWCILQSNTVWTKSGQSMKQRTG